MENIACNSERLLILPGDPEFNIALATPPPDWRSVAQKSNTYAFVADIETGMLRTVDGAGCQEYLLGGEYYDRLAVMHDLDDDGLMLDELEGVEEIYIDF